MHNIPQEVASTSKNNWNAIYIGGEEKLSCPGNELPNNVLINFLV